MVNLSLSSKIKLKKLKIHTLNNIFLKVRVRCFGILIKLI
jgi:hypothetical protein